MEIQGVQSSLFHDQKQKPWETVDAYAQNMSQRFYKAYLPVVLANQFVARQLFKLKTEVAGTEGKLEQVLTKA